MLLVDRVSFDEVLERSQYLGHSLYELGLTRVLTLHVLDDAGYVGHGGPSLMMQHMYDPFIMEHLCFGFMATHG